MDQYHPQHSGRYEFERHALEELVKTLEEALGPDAEVRHKSGLPFSSSTESDPDGDRKSVV